MELSKAFTPFFGAAPWLPHDILSFMQDAERQESVKAGLIAAAAGAIASLPLVPANGGVAPAVGLLSTLSVAASCLLMGIVYRYALRKDLGNSQLKVLIWLGMRQVIAFLGVTVMEWRAGEAVRRIARRQRREWCKAAIQGPWMRRDGKG